MQGRRSSETEVLSQSVVRVGADGLWGTFASERGRWRRITPATDMCPRYLSSVWAGYLLADLFKTFFIPNGISVLSCTPAAEPVLSPSRTSLAGSAMLDCSPLSMAWTIPCESSGGSSRPHVAGPAASCRAEEIRAGGCPDALRGSAVSPSRASMRKVAYAYQRGGVRF